jgi:hypothetical protein
MEKVTLRLGKNNQYMISAWKILKKNLQSKRAFNILLLLFI